MRRLLDVILYPVLNRRLSLLLLLLASLFILPSCALEPVCGNGPLDREVKECLKKEIEDRILRHYPFEEHKEAVDLDEFSSRVRELNVTLATDEFLGELQSIVASLQDGHTWLRRPSPYRIGRPPLGLRDVEEDVYVAWSLVDGIAPGDRLVLVAGMEPAELIGRLMSMVSASTEAARRRIAATAILNGPLDQIVEAVFERDGSESSIVLEREQIEIVTAKPPTATRIGEIGYIRLPSFAFLDDTESFDAKLNRLMDTEGLILDVRGNGGGRSLNVDLILGRFIARDLDEFEMIDSSGRVRARPRPKPRGERYEGELVLLTDVFSFSAANYLAHRVRLHGLGTIIGETTGGGAAGLTTVTLAQDVVLGYSYRLFVDPDGEHTESGVEPDIEVLLTAEDLRAGLSTGPDEPDTDKVLVEALRFLGGRP